MKNAIILSMVLMMTAVACKKNDTGGTGLAAKDLFNVSYGSDTQQTMDIYLPAGRTSASTKALIIVHGGAWVAGDKSEMNGTVAALRTLLPDYAFFNINYRLANSGGNLWPAQLDDLSEAVQFIRDRSNEYQFNTGLMAVGGASAGAHLALLYAYQQPGRFKAVADMFGPTDMKDLYQNSTGSVQWMLALFMGGTPASNPSAYHDASPLFFVNSASTPTIILHGTNDNVVPLHQSDSLVNRLNKAGVVNQYQVYTGEGHGVWSSGNTNDAYAGIAAFLKTHVK
ncbi:MAG TPA: alpha/beta hydrolase [Chitinophagaceae bacterium]